ncbi:MAG: hypothetical protein OEW69_05085, partial [Nitrospirota bacterium]|nr:hypothetical protein [Nitrospirota bacterium]
HDRWKTNIIPISNSTIPLILPKTIPALNPNIFTVCGVTKGKMRNVNPMMKTPIREMNKIFLPEYRDKETR